MKNRFDQEHAVIIILAIGLILVGIASVLPAERNTIAVSGSAELSVEPNEAEIYLGADTFATTAAEAQDQNSAVMNAIINALKGEGVPEEDIETHSFTVYPRYDYETREEPVIIGYIASHTLKITTKEIDKVGDLIDLALGVGGNKVQKVEFTVDKEREKEVKRELINKASLDAKNKAEGLASTLGVWIRGIKSVSESISLVPYRVFAEQIPMAGKGTVVPPSKVELSGSISIVYEIW